jgi:hypothetical protein
METAHKWALGLGAAGLLIAAVAYEKKAQAAPASAPATAEQAFLQLITDPNMVRQYQTVFANGISTWTTQTTPYLGLTSARYGAADIDGNPQNARWVAALSIFQLFANMRMPWVNGPVGFPLQLRADGVLDYATALAIMNSRFMLTT